MKKQLMALLGVAAVTAVAIAADPAADKGKKADAPAAKEASKADVKSIVETAAGNPDFSTLVGLLKSADLVEPLSGKGPFTVFAPTNAAFAKLPKETLAALAKPENKGKLQEVLKFHVIGGAAVMASDVVKVKESPKTLQGSAFRVSVKDKSVMIGNEGGMATVVVTDIKCTNGVIHVIDAVILPPAPKAEGKKDDAPKAPEKK